MGKQGGAVHVVRVRKSHVDKGGVRRDYQSAYLRRTFREGGKVRNETVANLSALPAHVVDWVEAGLKGKSLVPADQAATITASVPHGHVAAVSAQADALGLPALLGPAGRQRDLAMALIISRVVQPASKLATASWWDDTTLGVDLGVAGASTDEVYAAWTGWWPDKTRSRPNWPNATSLGQPTRRGWRCSTCPPRGWKDATARWPTRLLPRRQERQPADRVRAAHRPGRSPGRDPGVPRQHRRPDRVHPRRGDGAGQVQLAQLVMVGDRGMITNARIAALRATPTRPGLVDRAARPAIKQLAADGGPLQMTLFDQHNLAEITHPDYPGERLIACRNPFLAEERARKRSELLAATEELLAPITAAVNQGRLVGADRIGLRVGKIIDKYKMAKHLHLTITDTTLTITRKTAQIDAEAALDGIYVLRTSVPAATLDAAGVVTAYKNLAKVERDFRSLKVDDLDLRPIFHRLEDRVRAHVFIAMLAAYLTWHLRKTLAPLTFTDEHPPTPADPVAPATRSAAATRKASTRTTQDGQPVRSFRNLLDHLATLTRNDIQYGPDGPIVPTLAVPTPTQRRAFELLDTAIPLN